MEGMLVSTRDSKKKKVPYNKALLQGLAPDGGLFVPTEYPQLNKEELSQLKNAPYTKIAFEIKRKFIGESIPDSELKRLLQNAYKNKFHADERIVPVRQISDGLYIQNLSLGPTAAFKDMALQQLAQEMNFELDKRNEDLVILGATSGDTGSSAEAAVKEQERIKLFMLSPKDGMSDFQKAQMGKLTGENIFNIAVDGRFDDCQDLVKKVKKDPEFAKLGAVNSINWGRITSQVPYFVSGYLQAVENIGDEVDFVVPTGNFGNVLSGYIAKQMGVPIRRLIVATNENNVLSKLINTGVYEYTPSQSTSSPSMDISKASNYERLVYDIFSKDAQTTRKYIEEFAAKGKVDLRDYGVSKDVFKDIGFYCATSTHNDRQKIIKEVYDESGSIIDPHTADGMNAAKKYKGDVPIVSMETALPVKFEDTIYEALGFIPEREERFKDMASKNGFYVMDNNLEKLKEYIRSNI
ncbi:MAG: threonine synthase [Candidatus Nanoarchaeia archaeon]